MSQESVTLYYRRGGSDKVYHAEVVEAGGGFTVNFAFGRRGSTLQTGTKTPAPVPFDQAKKIFDKLVKSKQAKGYSEGPDGTPYAGTEKAERDTGLRPQLLNPISEDEADAYLRDDSFWLQEKIDGKRVLVLKQGGEVTGINRKGLAIALPKPVLNCAQALKGDFLLDGEAVGDRLVAFDCLRRGKVRLEAHPYRDRWRVLQEVVAGQGGPITTLSTAAAAEEKRDLLRFLRQKCAEGVVFKDRTAPYMPGRPSSSGPQVKLKFTAMASCIVAPGRNGRRSVALEVLDGLKLVAVGNVTIPGNVPIPKQGAIIDVKYLYCFPGGSLFQPVFLGVRNDILAADCRMTQLKYRREDEDGEA